jgi:hypothetical protein
MTDKPKRIRRPSLESRAAKYEASPSLLKARDLMACDPDRVSEILYLLMGEPLKPESPAIFRLCKERIMAIVREVVEKEQRDAAP